MARCTAASRLRFRFLGRRVLTLGLREGLPGVGEALRREIAGLVLLRGFLWGFVRLACQWADLTVPLKQSSQAESGAGLASLWAIWEVFYASHRVLWCRWCSPSMTKGSQVTSAAAGGVFGHVGQTFHAASLVDLGGALGCCMGSKVSMMINRPPQHGHGSARTLGS